jgi:acetyltransferase-like isoleucine patch superfamily enzyme
MIGVDAMLIDCDFHRVEDKSWDTEGQPIVVEDNAWIGNRCIILKGVTIGHDSVVAAGSVVSRDVPPRTLVFGVPARVVKQW